LVVGSWIFFLRCLDAPAISNYAGYIVTTVLGACTHIFNALSYPAQWIPIMRRSDRMKPWLGLIASVVLTCLLILPKILWTILTDVEQIRWVPSLSWLGVLWFFSFFSGSLVPAHGELLLLTLTYVTATGYGAFALIFGGQESECSGDSRRFILLGFAIPVAAVLLVSVVKPLLVSRYVSEALPFFLILCAVGLCRARPPWIRAAGLSAIAVLSLHQDYLYYRYYKRDDWRAATTYILSHAKPGDSVVLFFAGSRWPYDYYVSKSGSAEPPPVIFPDWDSHFRMAGIDWGRFYVDANSVEPILLQVIDDAPQRYRRVWLVLWPSSDVLRNSSGGALLERLLSSNRATLDRLLAAMGKRYRLNSEKDFPDWTNGSASVLLFDRASGAAP